MFRGRLAAALPHAGTRRGREKFLVRMDGLILWERLEGRLRSLYPKVGQGRRPYALSVMLRVYCMQLLYNLSDPG